MNRNFRSDFPAPTATQLCLVHAGPGTLIVDTGQHGRERSSTRHRNKGVYSYPKCVSRVFSLDYVLVQDLCNPLSNISFRKNQKCSPPNNRITKRVQENENPICTYPTLSFESRTGGGGVVKTKIQLKTEKKTQVFNKFKTKNRNRVVLVDYFQSPHRGERGSFLLYFFRLSLTQSMLLYCKKADGISITWG